MRTVVLNFKSEKDADAIRAIVSHIVWDERHADGNPGYDEGTTEDGHKYFDLLREWYPGGREIVRYIFKIKGGKNGKRI